MNIADMVFEPWMTGSFWEYSRIEDTGILVFRAMQGFVVGPHNRAIEKGSYHFIVEKHPEETSYIDGELEAQCIVWDLLERYK